jgi:integrase
MNNSPLNTDDLPNGRRIDPDRRKLSAVGCRNLQPKQKLYRVSDGHGLTLEVQPNGDKHWRYIFKVSNKQTMLSLGRFPDISLADARRLHEYLWAWSREGVDPRTLNVTQAQRNRRNREAALKNKVGDEDSHESDKLLRAQHFQQVAKDWLERQSGKLESAQYHKILQGFDKDVFPALGKRPVGEITVREVIDVLRVVEQRGALYQLKRLRQRMDRVFNFAQAMGLCSNNPAAPLKDADLFLTYTPQSHRHLEMQQMGEFLRDLTAYTPTAIYSASALRLLILTSSRTVEVIGARWSEFNLEGAMWELPKERMKMRRAHLVPLPSQAVDLLRDFQNLTGGMQYVFPGARDFRKSLSNVAMLQLLGRLGATVNRPQGWRELTDVHGFRTVFSTTANESGLWSPDAVELCLAHADRNQVRAAYNKSLKIQERRELLQWWADLLDRLESEK